MTEHPNRRRRLTRRAAGLLAALTALIAQVPASAPAQPAASRAAQPCAADPAESPGACSGQPLDARNTPLHVIGAHFLLPSGRIGRAYPDTPLVAGGVPHYSGEVTGRLPEGLRVLDNGYLAGTPSEAGVFRFTLRILDSSRPPQEVSQAYELRISRPSRPPPPPPPPPSKAPPPAQDQVEAAIIIYSLTSQDVAELATRQAQPPAPAAPASPPSPPSPPAKLYPNLKTWITPLQDVEYPSRALFESALRVARERAGVAMVPDEKNIVDKARKRFDYGQAPVLNWAEQPGCTCTPPAITQDATTVYGFFPFWRSASPPPGIVFNEINRVGLMGAQLTKTGGWLRPHTKSADPDEWWSGTSEFARRAQAHGTRLDLVLQRGDWGFLVHKTPTQRAELAQEAVRRAMPLIGTPLTGRGLRALLFRFWDDPVYVFDGVTLMFDEPADPEERAAFHDFYTTFVPTLIAEMQKRKRPYSLNVVVPDLLSLEMNPSNEAELAEQQYIWTEFLNAKKRAEPSSRYPDLPRDVSRDYRGITDITVRLLAPVHESMLQKSGALRRNLDLIPSIRGNDRAAILNSTLPILYLPTGQTVYDSKLLKDDLAYFRWTFTGVGLWPLPAKGARSADHIYKGLPSVTFDREAEKFTGEFGAAVALCSLGLRLAWQFALLVSIVAAVAYVIWGQLSGRWKFYRALLWGLIAVTTGLSLVLLLYDSALVELRHGNTPLLTVSGLLMLTGGWFFFKPKVPRP